MKLISKIVKGDANITQTKNKTVYEYTIFPNLSIIIDFVPSKKSLKISVKAKSFTKQLMYIVFN